MARGTRGEAGTVLIVEDDAGIALLERRRLERVGYAVEVVATAAAALERIATGGIDLLVLDQSLPGPVTGLEVYAQLKELGLDVPVIMVTGQSNEAVVIQALRLGVQDFVTKSIEYLDYLPEAVGRVLDRVRMEQRLDEREQQFRATFNQAAVGIAHVGLDGERLLVNQRLCDILGYQPEELTTDMLQNLTTPEDLAAHRDLIGQLVAGEITTYTHETCSRHKDGHQIWVNVAVSLLQTNAIARYLIVIVEDVTARKTAEAQLRQREEQFRSIVETTTAWIWESTPDGRLTYTNPALTAILGYAPEELLGADYFHLMHPDDRQHKEALLSQLAGANQGWTGVVARWRHKDGSERHLESSAVPILDGAGKVVGFRGSAHDLTDRKRLEDELAHQAFHDSLTGLPNRALFLDRLTHAWARAGRAGDRLAVLFLDLDQFKVINDSLGHAAGDQLLMVIAQRLRQLARQGDTVARLGGDEFALLLEGLTDVTDALTAAQRLQTTLHASLRLAGREIVTSASIGIALSSPDHANPADVLRDAEVAMYRAKGRGAGNVEVFDPSMHRQAMARLEMEAELRSALARHELRLVYQPIVSLTTGRIVGVEALARWTHSTRGVISPADFIPLAEETGLILPLGQWAMTEACRQVRHWQTHVPGAAALRVSVNVSSRQLQHPDFTAHVEQILAETGLTPDQLSVELTESVLMEMVDMNGTTLMRLRELGIHVALDDFGTGYSSFNYVKRLAIDDLKIDRSFIQGLGTNDTDQVIVGAIIAMAHALGAQVVAEGVETIGQLEALRSLDCDLSQGYYFARPLPPERIEPLLASASGVPAPPLEAKA